MTLGYKIAQAVKPTVYTVRYPRKMAGKPLLYISSALASLGDALFGYSQGITAAFQVQPSFIQRIYGTTVTPEQIKNGTAAIPPLLPAILIACLSVTALFAALASAYTSDYLGRRKSIRIGAVLYLIASCIQMIAPNFAILIVGRSIQGLGAGILSTTVPIFQVEIAPANARGMFAGIEALCMNAGYAASAWVGYAFFANERDAEHAWRGPYGVQAAVSLVLVLGTFAISESPRWLIQNGFRTEGLWTLADLHAAGDVTDEGVNQTYYAIADTLELEGRVRDADRAAGAAPWRDLFKNYPRRTRMGLITRTFAQLNGISAILHFLPEGLTRAGFSVSRALFLAACCALLYAVGPLPAILFVDRLGRRRFLLVGSIALAGALVLVGCLQLYVDHWPRMLAYVAGPRGIFIGMGLYLFFFGATWGPVPWLLSAELFPLRMRARGMAITTACDWFFECVVCLATPPLLRALPSRGGSAGAYYLVLAGVCALSGLAVWLVCVETGGKRLEAVGGIFGDPLPPPRMLEMEDEVVQVLQGRRRGGHRMGGAALSVPSLQLSAAGNSAVTLYPSPSVAGTSEVTLRAPLLDPELGEKSRKEKVELAGNSCSEMGVDIAQAGKDA
ncbi:hypothetical protein B0H11DRAFT_1867323 [Mycena galericulata]|nr:hypothetical protein B0H11DRAFT_1867323 [Mycena galericulata]